MTFLSKQTCMLAASLGVVWLVTGTPAAYAAGEKSDAKEACQDLLQDKGYKHVDTDQAKKTGDNRVRVEADAKRNGNNRDVDCVYNSDTDKAHIKK
jgi:NADPH:quinone reductase-like Zn-dependent oxidoreductase